LIYPNALLCVITTLKLSINFFECEYKVLAKIPENLKLLAVGKKLFSKNFVCGDFCSKFPFPVTQLIKKISSTWRVDYLNKREGLRDVE
jgi:hypothetical protein